MSSKLKNDRLIVNNTQTVTGIMTSLNPKGNEVATCGAILKYLAGLEFPTVGGILFYINSDSTNTYTFYDASGTQVSEPTVGTDCTGWTYTKNGDGVDKFYIYYPTLITNKYWGYYDISIPASASRNTIGAGKTNTAGILNIADTSAYASGSIWEYTKYMRANWIEGCNDWYVGCNVEYDQLRSSGTTGASWFSSGKVWSSVKWNNTLGMCSFSSTGWTYADKNSMQKFIPIRSF